MNHDRDKQLILANQQRIIALSRSLTLWETANVPQEIRDKVSTMREELYDKLRKLEIEGQSAKIAMMTEALDLYKQACSTQQ